MNSEVPIAVRRFLDVEAEVHDDDEHEEEEEGYLSDFINNDQLSESEEEPSSVVHRSGNSIRKDDDAFDRLLARICFSDRTRSFREVQHDSEIISTTYQTFSIQPSASDYPLWRIQCRLGAEEYALLHLLEHATSEHDIYSAFTPPSVRGWIYLECRTNHNLTSLLERTPGIVVLREGIQWQKIPPSDWIRTLTTKSLDAVPHEGKWVQVQNGGYKNDVGIVVRVETWGLDVLLVPRLKSLTDSESSTTSTSSKAPLKRKRTWRPKPVLFDPDFFKNASGTKPKRRCDNFFRYAGCYFEHGLLRKSYGFRSVSMATEITSDALSSFLKTNHPIIVNTKTPRPTEWQFETGEPVSIRSSGQEGIVLVVGIDHVEVELANFEGHTCVPWNNIWKRFSVGDYISVTSGVCCGEVGWIEKVEEGIASVVSKIVEGPISTADPSKALQSLELHVNMLKLNSVPFLHDGSHSPATTRLKTDKSPWLGVDVTITRGPFKGYHGTVKGVLIGQATNSNKKIEVQLSHISGSRPFRLESFDYDGVVETRRSVLLPNQYSRLPVLLD